MAADGTMGRRVNGQSLKKEYAKTMTHLVPVDLVPVDRATPRDGALFRKYPIERVFSLTVLKGKFLALANPLWMRCARCKRHFALRSAECTTPTQGP